MPSIDTANILLWIGLLGTLSCAAWMQIISFRALRDRPADVTRRQYLREQSTKQNMDLRFPLLIQWICVMLLLVYSALTGNIPFF